MIDEEVCEECPLYGMTGTDHCEKDCIRLAINALEQEPCKDAISRQAMHNKIEKWITYGEYKYSNATQYLYDRIDRLPPVNPAEKVGKWKRISMDKYSEHAKYWYRCDRCGEDNLGNTNYCPNCGQRKMQNEASPTGAEDY